MTRARGEPDGATDSSPWATDDVPVPSEPPQIVWRQRSEDDVPAVVSRRLAETEADQLPGSRHSRWTRPRILAPAGIAVLLLLAVVVWPRGGDSPETADRSATTDSRPEALDTLPRSTAQEPATETAEATETDSNPQGASGEPIDAIELPPTVTAIQRPTEVVILTQNRELHTLSLPSGHVRTVGLTSADTSPANWSSDSLVVAPDATLVVSLGQPIIVPRAGRPQRVDVSQFAPANALGESGDFGIEPTGWIRMTDGSSAFRVVVYGPTERREFVIAPDGTATVDTSSLPRNAEVFPSLGGDRFVHEAGGTYRLSLDGTVTRVSSGRLVATSAEHIVVRECDDALICSLTVIPTDGSVAARRSITDPAVIEQLDRIGYGATISPDGTLVAGQSSDLGEMVLVDLESGATVPATQSSSSYSSLAWAPDSSGAFAHLWDRSGMVFVDRSSGEITDFGREFGRIAAIAVRAPDSELLTEPAAVEPLAFSAAPVGLIGLDLVATDAAGFMTLLDLDDATLSYWEAPPMSGPPPRMFSSGRRVLVAATSGKLAYTAAFGISSPVPEAAVPRRPLFPGSEPGAIWARHPDGTADIDQIIVAPFGEGPSTGTRLTVQNGDLLGADGAGGLVIATAGDIYTSSGSDLSKLTTGELVAIGPTTAYVRECDEQFACALVRIDRVTGDRSPVVSQNGIVFASAVDTARDVSLEGSVSPDGDVAFVTYPRTAEEPGGDTGGVAETADQEADRVDAEWAFFDLQSGGSALVPQPLHGQPIVWNDDSSYAAIATEDGIVLFERATASVIQVTGTEQLRSIVAVDPTFATPSA